MDLFELFAVPKTHHDQNILLEVSVFVAELVKPRLQSFVTGNRSWSGRHLEQLFNVLSPKIGKKFLLLFLRPIQSSESNTEGGRLNDAMLCNCGLNDVRRGKR